MVVSTGNEVGISTADYLWHFVNDEATDTIVLYCETIAQGAHLRAALAEAARRGKRIVALLTGQSDLAQASVRTHTGNLAISRRWVDVFRSRGSLLGGASILAQRHVDGVEILVGITDPDIGTLVTVGLGGIWAEVLSDLAVRSAPVSQEVAMEMIDSLRGRRILGQFRGQPAADVDALAHVVSATPYFGVSQRGVLCELDLNPVIVSRHGDGALVADAFGMSTMGASDG